MGAGPVDVGLRWVVQPAADAFLQVGVFVAPLLLAFAWLQHRTGGRITAALAARPGLGPLVGAALGALPGCGGAIVVMPLFARGTVSFGTVVAALVATMGDSSFVLIAADPLLALGVHALLLVVGAVTGALVDVTGLRPGAPARVGGAPARVGGAPARIGGAPARAGGTPTPPLGSSTVGAAAAVPVLLGRRPLLTATSPGLVAWWSLVVVGLLVAVPVAAGSAPGPVVVLGVPVDPVLAVGGTGGLLTAAVVLAGNRDRRGRRLSAGVAVAASTSHLPVEAARETARVTAWVALAFAATAAVAELTGLSVLLGEGPAVDAAVRGQTAGVGVLGVLAGAAVGLLPGCGPQIVLTGLYAQGVVPFAMLIANALSQDGDALFALLAGHRRVALLATAISTVPGVVVGLLALAVTAS